MPQSILPVAALLLATVPLPSMAQTKLPLPAKTDIPADFSTVLCPDAAAAVKMLDYHVVAPAPNNATKDIDAFFRGLKATKCRQDDAQRDKPITIKAVLARKTLRLTEGTSVFAAYSGVDGYGRAVIGVVDESWNDRLPRTAVEKWLEPRTQDRKTFEVFDSDEGARGYACPTSAAARAVVKAIPASGKISDARKQKLFDTALVRNKCAATKGKFRPIAIFEDRGIGCGEECVYIWTALEAIDANGRRFGLIFDASLM